MQSQSQTGQIKRIIIKKGLLNFITKEILKKKLSVTKS